MITTELIKKNRFLLATSHTHSLTHARVHTHTSFVVGSSLFFKAKPTQISGESDVCKCQEFCFGFHTNPKLLASLCMLVYQGACFTVLSGMIYIYQVSTIFFSCRNGPYPTSNQICIFSVSKMVQ